MPKALQQQQKNAKHISIFTFAYLLFNAHKCMLKKIFKNQKNEN